MKKILVSNLFFFICLNAFTQVKLPAPSPTQTIKQDFALGSIELKYSRPGAKGRTVYGDLVPYHKLWRTGANSATVIKFSDPVEIMGKKIDSGSYAIYTIPSFESWDIIFNKGITNSGTTGYKESEDVLKFKIQPVKMKTKLETFTMQFENIKPESCELNIMWEKTAIIIPITINIKDKIRARLDSALLTDKKPYWQAAQFYNEYDKNPVKAMEYVTKAIDENPKAFYMMLYKAKMQLLAGDKEGALESSKRSLEVAIKEKNDDYIILNNEFQKKLQ